MRRSLALWIAVPVLVGILSYWLVSTSFIRKLEAKLTGAPVIEYPQSVDLGEQEQGSVAVAPLTIANRGRSELVVNGIGSSCSCSGLEQEQQGAFVVVSEFRLAPGEERHLRVRVSVNGFPGDSVRNSLTFHTNDPDSPLGRIEVLISRVGGGITTTPRTAVFGTVLVGSQVHQVVEVWAADPSRQAVKSVSVSNPDRLGVRWMPADAADKMSSASGRLTLLGRIEVSLSTKMPGSGEGTIEIQSAGAKPTSLSVVGQVVPLVEISPARMLLPRASGTGELWFCTCLCRSNERLPLTIIPAASDDGLAVQVGAVDGSPHLQRIRVEMEPPANNQSRSPRQRTVRLKARIGTREFPLEIPVQCHEQGGI